MRRRCAAFPDDVLSYIAFWNERGHKLTRDRRTSLNVDLRPEEPVDACRAPQGRPRLRQRSDFGLGDPHADRPLGDRCAPRA